MNKNLERGSRARPRLFKRSKKSRRRKRSKRRTIEHLELRAMLTGVTLIDINQDLLGSEPDSFTTVGDEVFFVAHDGIVGNELWKTDGTDAGTVLVKDIAPGPQDSIGSTFGSFVDVDGTLFFGANDGVNGFELWKSDGTTAGTTLVKDIFPGNNLRGSSPHLSEFTAHDGKLFFYADDGVNGLELWTSDGTEEGTQLVQDINPNGGQSNSRGSIVSFGDVVLFGANDGVNGRELWQTDGTQAGTSQLVDVRPGSLSGFFGSLTLSGSFAYFTGNNGDSGEELFRTDGTASGTVLLEITPGSNSSRPESLTDLNGTLFTAADGPGGLELWKSDGTAAGTVLVRDILPGPGDGLSFIPNLTAVGDTLFFEADDGTTGDELWASDGTEAGTRLVREIRTSSTSFGPTGASIDFIVDVNGVAFLSALDDTNGRELWTSDGTEAGTQLVLDINPDFSGLGFFTPAVAFGDELIFAADDGEGLELWSSDGSESGTLLVSAIDSISTQSSAPAIDSLSSATLNDEVIFRATMGRFDSELFRSDGTRAGTTLIQDINPDGSSFPLGLTTVGDQVFFSADDGANGEELWRTDGTDAGTRLVSDIQAGPEGSDPSSLSNLNGNLIFSADDGVTGEELWISDGTEAGTTLLRDITPGSSGSDIRATGVFGDELFFSANFDELWKTDGTSDGTVLVRDISPGSGRSFPGGFTVFNDALFFIADGSDGRELWRTDGTESGTVQVTDIQPGPGDAFATTFNGLFVEEGRLLFAANDGVSGTELWQSDGTEAGTVLIRDINPGSASSSPRVLGSIDGTTLLSANTADNGTELWRTDGTESGTELVRDITPGPDSSIAFFSTSDAVFEGELYFGATDQISGVELWKSDGTEAGTVLVEDILPGPNGSFPREFRQVDGRLLFSAGGEGGLAIPAGRELFRLGIEPTTVTGSLVDTLADDVNNDGNVDPGDTIEYTVTITAGDADADTVTFSDSVDPNTSIVPGSVSTSQGTVINGSTGGQEIEIGFGTIGFASSVTVTYSVLVNDPLPGGVTQITNQGTISGNNFDDVLTDDPAVGGTNDPTTTTLQQDSPTGIAPVATDFLVGTIPVGTVLSVDAVDIISEFGTDADSVLTANSVSFDAVTVDGTPVGSVADVGFTYTPGSGSTGAFTIDTEVSAFVGLTAGESVDVTIDFTVSDGDNSDDGVLSYSVTGSGQLADNIVLSFTGPVTASSELSVSAADDGTESNLAVSAGGVEDVSEVVLEFNNSNDPEQTFRDIAADDSILIVGAFAQGAGAEATATANDFSDALAIALGAGTTATAFAANESSAIASAIDSDLAGGPSAATAVANVNSAASAVARETSDALSFAENGSTADADAEDASSASAASDNGSVANATSLGGSTSTASASQTSSATAFSDIVSIAEADASDESTATATSNNDSESTAFASTGSTGAANATDISSAQAAADNGSAANAEAEGDSLATAVADGNSAASAGARGTSDAGSLAENESAAAADAEDASSSVATSDNGSVATAFSRGGSTSVANASQTSSATAFSDIESTASADAINVSISNAIGLDRSDAVASASDTADATSAAVNGGSANATAELASSATAASEGGSSTSLATDNSIATAIDVIDSIATAEASDNSVANAAARNESEAESIADDGSFASAVGDENSRVEASATVANSVARSVGQANGRARAFATSTSYAEALSQFNSVTTARASTGGAAQAEAKPRFAFTLQRIIPGTETARREAAGTEISDNATLATTLLTDVALTTNASAFESAFETITNLDDDFSRADTGTTRSIATATNGQIASAFTRSGHEVRTRSALQSAPGIVAAGGEELVNLDTGVAINVDQGETIVLPFDFDETEGNLDFVTLSGFPVGTVLSEGTTSDNGITWQFDSPPSGDVLLTLPETFAGSFDILVSTRNTGSAVAFAQQEVVVQGVTPTITTFLSVSDATVVEGDSGVQTAELTITRDNNQSDVSVEFRTINPGAGRTAIPSEDFTRVNETVNFVAGGSLTQTVSIDILGDTMVEEDEIFEVRIFDAQNAEIADRIGVIQIVNDDAPVAEGRLIVPPLVVGPNELILTGETPGAFSAFVFGTATGSTTLSNGVTVGIAAPSVPVIGVADQQGNARVIVNLTEQQLSQPTFFQAFGIAPVSPVSNLVQGRLAVDVNGDFQVSSLDALLVVNNINGQSATANAEGEDVGFGFQQSSVHDVNGDGTVSALDALVILNHLQRTSTAVYDIAISDTIDDDEDLLQLLAEDTGFLF